MKIKAVLFYCCTAVISIGDSMKERIFLLANMSFDKKKKKKVNGFFSENHNV